MHLITLLLKFYCYIVNKKETKSQNPIVIRKKLKLRVSLLELRLNLCDKQIAGRDEELEKCAALFLDIGNLLENTEAFKVN